MQMTRRSKKQEQSYSYWKMCGHRYWLKKEETKASSVETGKAAQDARYHFLKL